MPKVTTCKLLPCQLGSHDTGEVEPRAALNGVEHCGRDHMSSACQGPAFPPTPYTMYVTGIPTILQCTQQTSRGGREAFDVRLPGPLCWPLPGSPQADVGVEDRNVSFNTAGHL
ncbi:hypothetical protein Bbelb_414000 [Branchiostoma belcheri]|nr:hypothetical protein Bbelb_414000 [Branchiostoma belcheri]